MHNAMDSPEQDMTAPFVRCDQYGSMGTAISSLGLLDLACRAVFWLPYKATGAAFCVVACYSVWQVPFLPSHIRIWLSQRLCHLCLFFIGFNITVVDLRSRPPSSTEQSRAIISNHVSWIDILVLMVRDIQATYCFLV